MLVVIGTAALLLRATVVHWPLASDEGAYAYTALWWTRGLTLYGPDLWLERPQGIVFAYVPPVVLAEGSVLAIRAWGALWVAASAIVVATITARAGGSALVGGLVFAALSISPFAHGWQVQSEHLMVLPASAAVLALLSRRPTLAGTLAASAMLIKPTAIDPILIAPLLIRGLAERVRFMVGGLGVGAAALLHGALTVGLDAYVGAVLFRLPMRDEVSATHPLGWILLAAPVWLGPLLVGARAVRFAPWLAAWLGATVVGVAMGGNWAPYYFVQALPPMAALVGVAAIRFAGETAWRLVAVSALAWTIAVNGFGIAKREAFLLWWWNDEVGAIVRRHTRPGDTVFPVFEGPSVLYLSGRQSISRHMFLLPLVKMPGEMDAVLAKMRASVPTCVVLIDDAARRIPHTLPTEYRLVPGPAPIYCR